MKPLQFHRGLRVLGPTGSRVESQGLLLAERGRSRASWLLRWLPVRADAQLNEELRPDTGALALLEHPSLALPRSFGTEPDSGRAYLLRPHVEGADILSALREVSPAELGPWFLAAAESLGVLHRFGHFHGNIKGSNLIVPRGAPGARKPRGPRVVLCDPAWHREEPADSADSMARDLLDLGTVFNLLLTGGRTPQEGATEASIAGPDAGVPIDLARIVARLLETDPRRRYGSVSGVTSDLRLVSDEAVASPPPECFVGRAGELGAALAALGGGDRPGVLAVAGEAGMGKSAFIRLLICEAELRGFRAIRARSYVGTGAPGMPLRALAEGIIPPGAGGRGLRSRYEKLIGETPCDDGDSFDSTGRRVLLKSFREVFLEAASLSKVLLVVEDVHLADPFTVEFLAGLAREIEPSTSRSPRGLSLTVSYRTESPFRSVLKPLLDSLGSTSSAAGKCTTVLELQPLPMAAVNAWIEAALPEEPEARERVRAAAGMGGRPYAVREALRLVSGGAPPDARAAEGLPFLHRGYVDSLEPCGRQILEMLAVLGRPADERLLERLAGASGSELKAALGALDSDGTLKREGASWFFRHESFQTWLAESLSRDRKRAVHRALAQALERSEAHAVLEVAHHWLESDSPRRGTRAALEAARALVNAHEPRSALRFYLTLEGTLPPGSKLCRMVAWEAAGACARAGDHRRGAEVLARLLERARTGAEKGKIRAKRGVFLHRAGDIGPAQRELD
ncbi:MAG TPA: AAA family ATPase, partial [Planctomycetota bacterium]|nr:AAA family ATPase [Planctomycetota bacterium]